MKIEKKKFSLNNQTKYFHYHFVIEFVNQLSTAPTLFQLLFAE